MRFALHPRTQSAAGSPRAAAARGQDSSPAATRDLAPLAALGLMMALSLAVLLHVTRGEGFYVSDDFNFVMDRHSWSLDALLLPYNGHLVALPNAVFNVLFDLGGFDNYLPYRLGTIPLTLVGAGLVFVYARRRVGDWPALAAAAAILFFGTAWEVMLLPIGILTFVVPVAAGIAALLALDRGDRFGDALACGFLTVGLLSQSVALIFLGAAAVELLLGPRRLRRSWVVAVPAALYLIWFAKYGHTADEPSVLDHARQNYAVVPRFAFDGIAATFGRVAGPGEIARQLGWSSGAQHALGAAIGVCVAALLAVRLAAARTVRPRLWGLIAAFGAFWLVTALVRGNRPEAAEQSRYLYPSAVLLLLILVEALRGVRLTRVWAAILAGAVALSVIPNLIALGDYGREVRDRSRLVSGKLAALDLEASWVRSHEEGSFSPGRQLPTAGEYFSLTARYSSSPAIDPQEIQALGPQQRHEIDAMLEQLLGLRLTRPRGALDKGPGDRGCVGVLPAGTADIGVELAAPSAHVVLEAKGSRPMHVQVRRFAGGFPASVLGSVPAGSARLLRFPPDALPDPWWLRLSGGPGTVCSA